MSGLNAPRVTIRPGAAFAALWVAFLLMVAVIMAATFIRLGRPSGSTEFRPTNPNRSWIPAPLHQERAMASREVGP